jgi:hypothetical protein
MSTILNLLLVSVLVIAIDFAWSFFDKTEVYRLLRDSLARFSGKVMRLFFG